MNMFSMIAPNVKAFADQGLKRSTFVATNPTPGTGIASLDAATSRSATVGLMNIFNGAATDGTEPYWIIPVWLKLSATAINTTASDGSIDFYLDSANRYSSGGSAITEVPLLDDASADYTEPTSKATIHFGDLTLAAATDENLVCHRNVATAILAVDDEINLYFGDGPEGGGRDGTLVRGPGPFVVPPMWIGPGANLSIHWYGTAQAADPGFEFELLYIEKPNANGVT
jgi:hypothetical protein